MTEKEVIEEERRKAKDSSIELRKGKIEIRNLQIKGKDFEAVEKVYGNKDIENQGIIMLKGKFWNAEDFNNTVREQEEIIDSNFQLSNNPIARTLAKPPDLLNDDVVMEHSKEEVQGGKDPETDVRM